MKPALTLTTLFFIFVLPRFPVAAQEHVDVPLPPYDPPPTVSHHRETQPDQPPRSPNRQSLSPSKVSRQPHAPAKGHTVQNPKHKRYSHHHPRRRPRSRRHSFFRWPWQHR